MDDIVFTKEISNDELASDKVNNLLAKGWTLLHVGTESHASSDETKPYYVTVYVLGASQEQYSEYLNEINSAPTLEELVTKNINEMND